MKVSKGSKEALQRNSSAATNGNPRPHPRSSRRPEDPNSLRPSSAHRRRDPSKLSGGDRDRERHRERRDRPAIDPSRRPRPRSNSESSVPNDRAQRKKDEGHIHKSRTANAGFIQSIRLIYSTSLGFTALMDVSFQLIGSELTCSLPSRWSF